jgi:hypothetical protein
MSCQSSGSSQPAQSVFSTHPCLGYTSDIVAGLEKDFDMKRISVVVPVKDERDNVVPLFERLDEALLGQEWEVIFVDDGSTDGTATELKLLSVCESRVKVVRLKRNFGQSAAMQAGFDHVSGDIVVTLDGDLQNDPADIPAMLAKLEEGFDVVLGERAQRQDKMLVRKIPSGCANWVIRKVTRVPFKDFGCTLRVMRRDVVDELSLYGEMHRFITAFAVQQGARVAQVPVRHHPRTSGVSKYNLTRTIRVILDLMTVTFLHTYQTRPMHLFGFIGVMLGLAGSFSVLSAIVMKYTSGPGMTANPLFLLGVMGVLMSVQFVSLGLMGELLTRIYFESQNKTPYTVREMHNLEPAIALPMLRPAEPAARRRA